MSFSSEQKSAIIEKQYKSRCCRRALLMGAVFAKAYVTDGCITMSLPTRDTCDFLSRLIREFLTKDIVVERSSDGGRRYLIKFNSNSASDYIANIQNNAELYTVKCDSCQSSFLRGVFLASARVGDPKANYSIHFSLGERASVFAGFLSEIGIDAHIFESSSGDVLYLKDSGSIENFFAYSAMNKAMFSIIEARMEGEIRRHAARVSNCETNNIKKAVDAAVKQYDVIKRLEEANLLSSLPEDLEVTARLRLAHKEMSLSQLSAISVPPISKPGLSHRLKKITEIGERLLSGK